MAYPTRGRDPLLDATTQAFLQKRGVEALGLILFLMGVFLTLVVLSYSPDDSAWMSSGDREIGNLAGQIGATIGGTFEGQHVDIEAVEKRQSAFV